MNSFFRISYDDKTRLIGFPKDIKKAQKIQKTL